MLGQFSLSLWVSSDTCCLLSTYLLYSLLCIHCWIGQRYFDYQLHARDYSYDVPSELYTLHLNLPFQRPVDQHPREVCPAPSPGVITQYQISLRSSNDLATESVNISRCNAGRCNHTLCHLQILPQAMTVCQWLLKIWWEWDLQEHVQHKPSVRHT